MASRIRDISHNNEIITVDYEIDRDEEINIISVYLGKTLITPELSEDDIEEITEKLNMIEQVELQDWLTDAALERFEREQFYKNREEF